MHINDNKENSKYEPIDVYNYVKECSDCDCDNCEASLFSGLVYCGVIYPELNKMNPEKAELYLRRAVDAGDQNAVMYLINAYLSGVVSGCNCCIKPDYNKWHTLIDELANKGNQTVAYGAALWYSGIGKPGKSVDTHIKSRFKTDQEMAINYFLMASNVKDPAFAKASLEHLYNLLTTGNDVFKPDKDRLKAILKQQAERGNQYAVPFLEKIVGF